MQEEAIRLVENGEPQPEEMEKSDPFIKKKKKKAGTWNLRKARLTYYLKERKHTENVVRTVEARGFGNGGSCSDFLDMAA
ncbi:MAG: hypothetical protein IPJ00_12025 [Saprospirales bacterium]|nr:hypothetical protein [Saprospirales bacterium]